VHGAFTPSGWCQYRAAGHALPSLKYHRITLHLVGPQIWSCTEKCWLLAAPRLARYARISILSLTLIFGPFSNMATAFVVVTSQPDSEKPTGTHPIQEPYAVNGYLEKGIRMAFLVVKLPPPLMKQVLSISAPVMLIYV